MKNILVAALGAAVGYNFGPKAAGPVVSAALGGLAGYLIAGQMGKKEADAAGIGAVPRGRQVMQRARDLRQDQGSLKGHPKARQAVHRVQERRQDRRQDQRQGGQGGQGSQQQDPSTVSLAKGGTWDRGRTGQPRLDPSSPFYQQPATDLGKPGYRPPLNPAAIPAWASRITGGYIGNIDD